jgi:hypothetical protein
MRSIGLDVGKRFAEVAISEPGRGTRSGGRISATPESRDARPRRPGRPRGDDEHVADRRAPRAPCRPGRRLEPTADPRHRRRQDEDRHDRRGDARRAPRRRLPADGLAARSRDESPPAPGRRPGHPRRRADQAPQPDQRRPHPQPRGCPWSDPFGRHGRSWLATVELPADERELVDRTLRLLDGLAAEIGLAEAGIARAVADDRRVRRLLSIPGIGLQTAVGLVAVVGDIGRFGRPNKLVGYLGLDPIVRQSGGRPAYTGHISHAGQGHVRGLLVEAALGAARVPGPLHAFYARVAGRRGHAIAIVAVARKLAVLAWHLLTHDVDYRWAPARLTATKIRAVELAAGAPSRRGRMPGSGDAQERAKVEREMERAVLAQAEAAYVAFVAARQETDAVAAKRGATGFSQGLSPARLRGGVESPISALRHGVDRVRAEDTPTA